MRLPLDTSHLEAPMSVVVAVCTSAVWVVGELLAVLAQVPNLIPDPQMIKDMTDSQVWKYIAVMAVGGALWLGRWVVTTLLGVLSDNTRAMQKVGESIDAWNQKADEMVMPAFKHAMNEAFAPDDGKSAVGGALGCGKKRGRPEVGMGQD